MSNIKNAFIQWMARIFDITGGIWKSKIMQVYNDNVLNWFKTDKKNIARDFNTARQKIKK